MKHKYLVYFLFILFNSYSNAQTLQDLQKLRSEYEDFKKGQNKELSESFQTINQNSTDSPSLRNLKFGNSKVDSVLYSNKRYYGYDFFTRNDSIAFWDNLPVPYDYILGPGDDLIILLWGETQLRKNFIISRDGTIYDDKVGLLNLSGKTLDESRKYLKSQFARVYSTLKGNNPSSYIDISIGRLGSINVNFVGNLNYPGVYPIHPFSTIITGLYQAGGIDTSGSLRNIQIKRNGVIYKDVDLYDYFIKGESSSIIQLRDQDIIVIP